MYPEVINDVRYQVDILKGLATSSLYKDIFNFGGIRKPEILEKLLSALAFQIGCEINHNELSRLLGIDKNTVYNYINLLCQTYIVFKLDPGIAEIYELKLETIKKYIFMIQELEI